MLAGASARLEDPSASIQSGGYVKHMVRAASAKKSGYQGECPDPGIFRVVTSLHKLLQ